MKAKAGKATPAMAAGETLWALKRQFERWRAARQARDRIPSHLWDEAVIAVAEHGAYRVSRELRLDYVVLKRRAGLTPGKRSAARGTTPRFVELVPAGAATLPAARAGADCVVELSNGRGARMRVELRGNALGSLGSLCQSFWAAP
jgi:hypothetical protein